MTASPLFRQLALSASAVLLLALPTGVTYAQQLEDYDDGYRSGDFGRVRFHENGFTMVSDAVRSESGAESSASRVDAINAPIFPGDRLETDRGQRVEVELAGGSLVHVDRDTSVTFLALPNPYSKIRDHAVLQLDSGALRITAAVGEDDDFRIDTKAASIYLTGDAELRIESERDGNTRVFSRRGVVEVAAGRSSVWLRGGMQTEVDPGTEPSAPFPFNTFISDRFDRFVEGRKLASAPTTRRNEEHYRELPREVRSYYGELDRHGEWVDTEEYGLVWIPDGTDADWRPYWNGYWSHGPRGYFWVSYDPWGWAPYHYGRWGHLGDRWCWIPGRVFAGAWVSWSWGTTYVGWSALSYWNEPLIVTYPRYGYYCPRTWTFLRYDHLYYGRHGHYGHPYHKHYGHYGHYRLHLHDVGDHHTRAAVGVRGAGVSPEQLASGSRYRQQAHREARDRRTSKIDPIARSGRSGSRRGSVRDLEQPFRAGARRADANRSPGQDRTRREATDLRSSRSRSSARSEPAAASSSRYPSRGVGDAKIRTRRQVQERDSVSPRGSRSSTSDRMRDVYREMSQPRQTRERSATRPEVKRGEQPRAVQPRATRPSERGSRTTTPRAVPERRSAPTRTTPKARQPERSRQPVPRAEPDRSRGRSAPRATPRRQPSRPPRTETQARPATPQRRSVPRAQPQRAPRPKPARTSPSRGNSRKAPTKATKPSSRSGRSQPSAAGSGGRRGATPRGSRGSGKGR